MQSKFSNFRLHGHALAVSALLAMTVAGVAQEYPDRSIRFVVGFSAGGFADSTGRILAEGVSAQLGQPVVVENQGGASGNIAAAHVAVADPDGYNVLVTTASLSLSQSTNANLEYDLADLAPVAIPVSSPETLAAHPSVPATNIEELVAWAQEQGTITLGHAGVGTGSHVTTTYFLTELAGLDNVTQVGFRGGSNARQAALSGEVNLVGSSNSVYPLINDGRLTGLAVASEDRHFSIEQVPTYREQGYEKFAAASWVGLFVPAGVDPKIQATLNEAVNTALADPDIIDRLENAGVRVHNRTLEESKAFFGGDIESWSNMVEALDIQLE